MVFVYSKWSHPFNLGKSIGYQVCGDTELIRLKSARNPLFTQYLIGEIRASCVARWSNCQCSVVNAVARVDPTRTNVKIDYEQESVTIERLVTS